MMSEYYGSNDFRDYHGLYLEHYGVKGMKWGKRKKIKGVKVTTTKLSEAKEKQLNAAEKDLKRLKLRASGFHSIEETNQYNIRLAQQEALVEKLKKEVEEAKQKDKNRKDYSHAIVSTSFSNASRA